MRPDEIEILYEDNHLLVVVKPPNLPVQADESGDRDLLSILKEGIAQRHNKPGSVFLGLVHRLDRPVGGVMVFARTSKAAARLSDQVRRHQLQKTYHAVVGGEIAKAATLVDYLSKDRKRNHSSVVAANAHGAKEARLHYSSLARRQGLTLVKIALETGRSHQIRVQFASRGAALWGDNRYGSGRPGQQIALWASELGLSHPTTKEPLLFSAALPSWEPWSVFAPNLPK